MTRLATPIMPYQKNLDQLLIHAYLLKGYPFCQHAKILAISSTGSREIFDSNIFQSDWLRTFWHISQKQDFPQIWDFCRNIANNINFYYRTNSVKSDDQIFQ